MADNDCEIFDVVNEDNKIVGRERRDICHKTGLLHRATHVLLFDRGGNLLLQRRSKEKKIGPGLLDLSVAEHVSEGEAYEDCAVRGLSEELGVTAVHTSELRIARDVYLSKAAYPEVGLQDNEFIKTFACVYEGPIEHDPTEVSETCYWTVEEVTAQMTAQPETFTPWFVKDMQHIDLVTLRAQLLGTTLPN